MSDPGYQISDILGRIVIDRDFGPNSVRERSDDTVKVEKSSKKHKVGIMPQKVGAEKFSGFRLCALTFKQQIRVENVLENVLERSR